MHGRLGEKGQGFIPVVSPGILFFGQTSTLSSLLVMRLSI
ncbi:hypothetical protein PCH70_37110 [Pseudomonas cichorii JBC1]|nr:hypothetical protein PCH70_37110 [Pseudomonas cichorii JBC1]